MVYVEVAAIDVMAKDIQKRTQVHGGHSCLGLHYFVPSFGICRNKSYHLQSLHRDLRDLTLILHVFTLMFRTKIMVVVFIKYDEVCGIEERESGPW